MAPEQYHPLIESEMSDILAKRLERLSSETIPATFDKLRQINWSPDNYSDSKLKMRLGTYNTPEQFLEATLPDTLTINCEGTGPSVQFQAMRLNDNSEVGEVITGAYDEVSGSLEMVCLDREGNTQYSLSYGTIFDERRRQIINLTVNYTTRHLNDPNKIISHTHSFHGWDPKSGWR
jgi:hypothetical protein